MKALDILKKSIYQTGADILYSETGISITTIDIIKNAIADLESQLLSNPLQLTCDGCEYVLDGMCANNVLCNRNSHPWKIDYYKKAKDTK